MRRFLPILPAASLALTCAPARAEVATKSEIGFVSRNTVEVAAKPEVVWAALIVPAGWWNSQHTYSADAANLSLAAVAGGCFCERLPVAKGSPAWAQPGSVEHMRVINIEPGKAMRLAGALGPLQSEPVNAVLTITLKPTGKGTRILFEYVVGGYMRYPVEQIAPAVDKVMLEQLGRLALKVDPVAIGRGTLVPPAGPPVPGGQVAGPPAPGAKPGAPIPAPKPVAPAPKAAPALDEAADKAAGAEAAAALDSLAAPKKPATMVAAPAAAPKAVPGNYAEQTFEVRKLGSALQLFDPARPTAPVAAAFASPALAARLASDFAAGLKDPATTGKAAICTCTGRIETADGKSVFSIIDAVLSFR